MLTGGVADACIYGTRIVFDVLLRQGKLRAFMRHLRAFRRGAAEPLRTTIAQAIVAPLAPLQVQRWFMAAYVRRGLARYGNDVVPPWIREPLRSDLACQNREILVDAERRRLFASPARHAEAGLLYPPEAASSLSPSPIELWQPFADRRLHEFLLAIPPDQKFEPHPDTDEFYAGSKWLVRRALRGILPESVRTRTTKTVFTSWLNGQIDQQWLEYDRIFGPNAQSEIASRGYVEQSAFYSRLERIRRGDDIPDLTWVMQLVGLEIWLRALALPRTDLVAVRRATATAPSSLSPQRSPDRDLLAVERITASATSWHAAP
jgi:asparagine synthase (glutamine-hydrolysing)